MTGSLLMRFALLCALALPLLLIGNAPTKVHADTASELQAQIDQHNAQIKKIEDEIAAYQKTLNVLSTTKQTLQSTIQTIDVSRSQTAAQISATKKKIDAANLRLRELALEIDSKELAIKVDKETVAGTLRLLDERDDLSMIEQLLSAENLGTAWKVIDAEVAVGDALRAHAEDLSHTKRELDQQHAKVKTTKSDLTSLNTNLTNEKQALDANRQVKSSLLTQTKNQETSFQSLIAKKRAEQKAFEAELSSLEDQLRITINPSLIAHVGKGVLIWPFSASFMKGCETKSKALGNPYCITQYFGNTPFSTANPQIYNGNGHNAVDFGAPAGTPIQSALSGTVLDTGNTDSAPGCYSFGKWVMVQHGNGISTLYAHLSSIKVSKGSSVGTGDVIGFSGMTGYATGPHLHFGVYATQGVVISTLGATRSATTPCASAKMPIAPKDAYLNPMSYL